MKDDKMMWKSVSTIAICGAVVLICCFSPGASVAAYIFGVIGLLAIWGN